MTCNVLVLAAGRSSALNGKQDSPLCLSELEGELLIEKIFHSTRKIADPRYFTAILDEDIRRYYLDDVFKQLVSDVAIVRVPKDTKGSACTALLAAVQMNAEYPLLIISSNELIRLDLNQVVTEFIDRGLDAGVLVFRALHPRYSFVRLSEDGFVVEAAQHRPISNHATAGTFWFAKTEEFIYAAKSLIRKDSLDSGNFYIAPVLNELILKQGKVGVFQLPQGVYTPLKNEDQVKIYEAGGR